MKAVRARRELPPTARHILAVAARLFAVRGYDATSVQMIVEAAGVTKPTLYHHFQSKAGVAKALLTEPMTALVAEVRSITSDPKLDPVERLVRYIECKIDFCREDPDRARFFHALVFGPMGGDLAPELIAYADKLMGVLAEIVEQLAESGVIDRNRAEDLAIAVRGVVTVATTEYLYRARPLDTGRARTIVDDLIEGFGTRRKAARGVG